MEANGAIFLPTAGFRHASSLLSIHEVGAYWTTSTHTEFPNEAYSFDFSSYYAEIAGSYHRTGVSVRLVYPAL